MVLLIAPNVSTPVTAFPAKAGTHFSTVSHADKWVPAFAGNAVFVMA